MNVAVLGASGQIGRLLVEQAGALGWTVAAVGRPSSRLPDGVERFAGDLADPAFLRTALRGRDAVASALGLRMQGYAPWHSPEDPTFLSRAAPAIVEAMKAEGVRRIVAVSAAGVGDSLPTVPWVFRVILALTALRVAYAELDRFEQAFFASGLDVCMCRPGALTDGPRTGMPRVTATMRGAASISRADVAAWMLEQLRVEPFPHRAPLLEPTPG